jgi:aminomethyltransferase
MARGAFGRGPAGVKTPTMSTEAGPLKRTPLYDEHRKLGARLVPFAGWEMPIQYAGVVEEHRAVRTAAGLFDVSHMGEIELRGEHAAAVVDYLVTGEAAALDDGHALYTCACNERGTILDDLIVYRVARDVVLVVPNAGNRDKISAHFQKAAEHHCGFEDRSDTIALLALQGPRALEILSLAGKDAAACTELKSFDFRDAVVANVRATVARTGYTGEDGVEIFCAASDAAHLWRTLLELGKDRGLQPIGLGARDTLRLEACLSLYGNDIDETTNPIEAGLGRIVKLDKPMFVGKDAIVAIKARGLERKLVGFEMTGRGIARHGYPLLDPDGRPVGICTSGGPSPTLGKNIALGYLPVALAALGARFQVDCRGKPIDAVVVKTPFYKRNRGAA